MLAPMVPWDPAGSLGAVSEPPPLSRDARSVPLTRAPGSQGFYKEAPVPNGAQPLTLAWPSPPNSEAGLLGFSPIPALLSLPPTGKAAETRAG